MLSADGPLQPALASSRCPICLRITATSDEAFLDQCYHRFCFQCIDNWTRQQLAHPAEGPHPLRCPTCRRPYSSVLLDCVHQAYRRKVYIGGQQASDRTYQLSAAQRRRRSLYASPALCESDHQLPTAPACRSLSDAAFTQSLARQEMDRWTARELQALLQQDDVTLLVSHILGTARHAARSGQEACLTATEAASAPYLTELAGMFAGQLCSFVTARSSIPGHDAAVFGPPAPVQPASSGESSSEAARSSASSDGSVAHYTEEDNDASLCLQSSIAS